MVSGSSTDYGYKYEVRIFQTQCQLCTLSILSGLVHPGGSLLEPDRIASSFAPVCNEVVLALAVEGESADYRLFRYCTRFRRFSSFDRAS